MLISPRIGLHIFSKNGGLAREKYRSKLRVGTWWNLSWRKFLVDYSTLGGINSEISMSGKQDFKKGVM